MEFTKNQTSCYQSVLRWNLVSLTSTAFYCLVKMGVEKLRTFILVSTISCLICICHGFTPQDNYLINCGSPTNSSLNGRVFMSDKLASKLLTSPKEEILASQSGSDIYQTARVFTGVSSYKFSVARGRHWVRLHFNPFNYQNFQMGSAKFAVSSQTHVLLSDFTVKSSRLVKEYSLNVTTDDLVLTFTPSGSSFAFVNAIEVISVPDTLITALPPPRLIGGGSGAIQQSLSSQALETVHRVNMGGPLVAANQDNLTRTWQPDSSFLLEKNLARSVSKIATVNFVPGYATEETAPRIVYGTCTEMNSGSDPTSIFNVTWEFEVDPGFQYFFRFHFCDIVSLSLNQLYFNLYIDSMLAVMDVDLSTYVDNTLAGAYNMDFVTQSPKGSNKIRVSIGPSTVHTDYPNAIVNGLEIMKMNNSQGQLSAGTFVPGGGSTAKQKNVGLIVGATIGPLLALVLLGSCFVLCRKRKLGEDGHSKTWMPFSINGTSVGSKGSNGTTLTSITTNANYRIPFAAVKDATNNFDESHPTLPREMVNLAEWAMKWQKKGQLDQIIDQSLRGNIRPDSLRKFAETGEKCLADYGVDRPSMGDVLWNLEYALQLQEAVVDGEPEDNSTNMIGELPPQINNFSRGDTSVNVPGTAGQFEESSIDDLSGVSMSKVFSQLYWSGSSGPVRLEKLTQQEISLMVTLLHGLILSTLVEGAQNKHTSLKTNALQDDVLLFLVPFFAAFFFFPPLFRWSLLLRYICLQDMLSATVVRRWLPPWLIDRTNSASAIGHLRRLAFLIENTKSEKNEKL
ncbi:unnamed protein product [Thlaspi arvense]|uniref:Malectin-like domain-containing protein n=1 Tax=Thlaspi arvense TaxID=13288 RepID=A0AAU9SGT9_THLAR|nr:unnamed protein product [Thlaspi arvense]